MYKAITGVLIIGNIIVGIYFAFKHDIPQANLNYTLAILLTVLNKEC